MLFNTTDFAIFFCVVLIIYWLCRKWRNVQNGILLVASAYFYYCFRSSLPVYLYCIICAGYISGIIINAQSEIHKRKTVLICAIVIIGAGLTYIKYSGLLFGNIPGLSKWQASVLNIVTPIGISYFTFSSIGYITEVYRKTILPERNFITYAAYISYFPHILSGPIPSAAKILPQFRNNFVPTRARVEQSLGEITWGLFKKMVVADNVVKTVNYVFDRYEDQNGSTLFLGTTLFSLYLYADFSGYSEIAMGTSRLLGIELTKNFRMPFFSRNPGEFWRRWHTSLRKWFLDYIYIPMGGKEISIAKYIALILFIFSFSGLWHGANYTFICWGFLNGLYFVPYILTGTLTRYKAPVAAGRIFPTVKEFFQVLLTFNLVTISRVFFRSPDIHVAADFFSKICSKSFFQAPLHLVTTNLIWCIPMLVVEWIQREKDYVLEAKKLNIFIRIIIFGVVIAATWYFHKQMNTTEYYYFKF